MGIYDTVNVDDVEQQRRYNFAPNPVPFNDPSGRGLTGPIYKDWSKVPTSQPNTPAVDPNAGYASRLPGNEGVPRTPFSTAPAAVDEEKIRADAADRAQSIVNAINKQFEPIFAEQTRQNEQNNKRTRAINISGGLQGSDFASTEAIRSEERGTKANKMLQMEKEARIAEILSKADDRASQEIAQKRNEFRQDTATYNAERRQMAEDARRDAEVLASSGVSLEKLKQQEPDTYQKLLSQTGMNSDLAFDAYFNSKKPAAAQTKYQFETIDGADGKKFILAYGIDPSTGQMVTQKYDAGITGGQKPIIVDGVPYFQDPNNPTALVKAGGFEMSEQAKADLAYKKAATSKLYRTGSGGGGGSDDSAKILAAFNKAVSDPSSMQGDDGVTREQFARQLQAQFPDIEPGDIMRKIYDTYPDSWSNS